MVDVFLIGVLVSLIKIAALADVSMGLSFWAFLYLCHAGGVKTISLVDFDWFMGSLGTNQSPAKNQWYGGIFQNSGIFAACPYLAWASPPLQHRYLPLPHSLTSL
ncbi:paraquat-inducible protein A [Vibrio chagasii]|nr:paraquat-inducible protein A [Vibrio chagasii]